MKNLTNVLTKVENKWSNLSHRFKYCKIYNLAFLLVSQSCHFVFNKVKIVWILIEKTLWYKRYIFWMNWLILTKNCTAKSGCHINISNKYQAILIFLWQLSWNRAKILTMNRQTDKNTKNFRVSIVSINCHFGKEFWRLLKS